MRYGLHDKILPLVIPFMSVNMNNNPIGIFDSGLGGLTVWREIRRLLPEESLLYFGDGENCPYGAKPVDDIRKYTQEAVGWLISKGVKLIVIACNTATAAAIEQLREMYPDICFVGMEPAVKPAALSTKTGVIGVLATEASLGGGMFRESSEKYGENIDIISAPGNGFVELVEENKEGTDEAYKVVRQVVGPLVEKGADKLVLGCTHYPFLISDIRRVIGDAGIEIVDSAPAVARRVADILKKEGLLAGENHEPEYEFYTLAGEVYLRKLIDKGEKALDMDF